MESIIQRAHRDDPAAQHPSYNEAKPFRHLVMDDFFTDEFATQLLETFPAFDTQKAMNENGQVGAKCVHEDLRQLAAPYRQLDEMIQSREFLDWLGSLTGIDELIYDPDYFGGGTHENRHGQDLDPHVDFNKHPKTGFHRRLNLIIYLNHEWDDEWGGAIEFHEDPRRPPEQNRIEIVTPRFNRAVLFETTHWSWHGFERINLPGGDADARSRKSVALYFYSKTRPPEEQTKPHSTIYVERPLPAHIRPGEVLADGDFHMIRMLLARRDQHLQRLYSYISDLNDQVEQLSIQRDRALEIRRESVAEPAPSAADPGPGLMLRARRWLARRLDG